jgi:hypothetical protein
MSLRKDISFPANQGPRYLQIMFRNEICHYPPVLPPSARLNIGRFCAREQILFPGRVFLSSGKLPAGAQKARNPAR